MKTNSRFWWGLALIAAGVLFLLDSMEILSARFVFRNFWPLILVIWGAWLLLRRSSGKESSGTADAPSSVVAFGSRVEAAAEDEIRRTNVFGELEIRIASKEFRGGKVSTVFGSTSVNLAEARPASGEQVLNVSTVFGSVRVVLPRDAAASAVADTLLGEVTIHEMQKSGFDPSLEWSSTGYAEASHKIRLDASTVMGSIVIIRAGG